MEQCCHKCTRHLQTQVCRQRNYRNRSIVLCAGLTDVHIISKGLFFCGKVSAKSLNKNLVTYTGTVVGSKMKFSRLTASCIYTCICLVYFFIQLYFQSCKQWTELVDWLTSMNQLYRCHKFVKPVRNYNTFYHFYNFST